MRFIVITAALLAILLPASAVADAPAQSFSVAPAEVTIDNLSPGETVEFELTIRNEVEQDRLFILTTFQPPEAARRTGRDEFPDDSWISFSPRQLRVASGSETSVGVTVAIPDGNEWLGRDWEIWLGVTVEPGGIVAVAPSVRMLVSTGAPTSVRFKVTLVVAIVVGAMLVGYVAYHLLRRVSPDR